MAKTPHKHNPDADAARALLEERRHGVLCTAHARNDGWPFGSIVPYALLPDGDPVVLLSAIAEHSRNLAAEPRACLFVHADVPGADVQSAPRVALLVRDTLPEGPAAAAAAEVYFARFPEARATVAPDSAVHVLHVEKVRWIAGFGSMGWIERASWSKGA